MTARAESTRIYARISADIASRIAGGEFRVGARLPAERDLAAAYGASRPTVREAIIALEVDGLVEVRQGSGVYVTADRPRGGKGGALDIGPFELLEARRAIEGEACALAAARITGEEVEELRALVKRMRDTNAQDEIAQSEQLDQGFHLLIARATRNSAIVAAVEALWQARFRSPQSRMLSGKAHAAGIKPRIDEHLAIVGALAARDPDAARGAMRAHIARVTETLLEITAVLEMEQARERVDAQRRRYAPVA